ncbi:hypothetical protein [Dechloromonas denitrificans]|uniref:hypothetical protein n=1 Tax=Dechloromonas denitrificans TaxID=281362 RepID=UPI001CF7F908|nr:hypothetical protein [Dechloromonas denitrificans]UCV01866.1 hypothetical protein KI611_12145 [Dechloromonas denitrificans]
MRTTNNKIPSVEFRIDPLGLDRFRWLKSFFSAHGESPSNSVIIRRALVVYLEQVEKTMKSDEKISLELMRLKAHTDGDKSPWTTSPRFDGRPFSKVLAERRKIRNAKAIHHAFGIVLPGLPAAPVTNHE